MPETYQLRVRLDETLRDKLLQVSSDRGKGETLSAMVRHAIKSYLEPHACDPEKTSIPIDQETKCDLKRLAEQLDRKPGQVVQDCIQGIVDIFERDRPALVVLELQLRKKYFAGRESPAGSSGLA
jgi:predicted transcriptional regulator